MGVNAHCTRIVQRATVKMFKGWCDAYKTCSGKVQFCSCKKNYMDSWRLWFLSVQYGKKSMVVKEITWILPWLERVWSILYMAVG